GQEDVAKENAYLELADSDEGTAMVRQSEEEVVTEPSKKVKKRRLQKLGDVLSAKKLKTDHPALASGTGGKTLAGLEQIRPAGSRLPDREQLVIPSVAPPSQESEGFLDSSARTNLRICTTVESSSALAILVDTTAAATTSTGAAATTRLATDVDSNLAGLEAGHEHEIAGRSLSAVEAYNPEAAKASYVDAVKALEDVDFPLVILLKSKKDAGMDEVLDGFLLDGPLAGIPEAAYLQPCIEQLSVPIHHAGDTMAVGETSLSFALMNVHAHAEGPMKHAAALRQLMMDIVSAPLSSQTWVGEASTSVAPLSVEDYDEEDTDKALRSVVAVPKFETCRF
ncbi:hypothetical protein Tco_1495487, partial [Tanacetum coccineum]